MSLVNINQINILDNPSSFLSPYQFEITFEVIAELKHDLEFKIIYVGSAESEAKDQVLEQVMVGPVPVGLSKFILEAPAPNPQLIPVEEVLGVTVILLTCSYMDKEFVRVGYYVNNEYNTEEYKENPPAVPEFDKLIRSILAEKPRVTRFPIKWDDQEQSQTQQPEASSMQQEVMMDA